MLYDLRPLSAYHFQYCSFASNKRSIQKVYQHPLKTRDDHLNILDAHDASRGEVCPGRAAVIGVKDIDRFEHVMSIPPLPKDRV